MDKREEILKCMVDIVNHCRNSNCEDCEIQQECEDSFGGYIPTTWEVEVVCTKEKN